MKIQTKLNRCCRMSSFLFILMCGIIKAPAHFIASIHQDAEKKPDDESESIDKRQTQNSWFDSVDKKYARELDGSETQNN